METGDFSKYVLIHETVVNCPFIILSLWYIIQKVKFDIYSAETVQTNIWYCGDKKVSEARGFIHFPSCHLQSMYLPLENSFSNLEWNSSKT